MGFPYILRKVEKQMGEGLILVNTGDGKGKTTAALGVALRSAGCGRRVLILQFIKSGANYGELAGIALLPTVEIRSMGKGFIFHKQDESEEKMKEHQQAAKEAWTMVETEVKSGQWDLIILDEINYAIHYGLVDVETVVNLLKTKPENLDMILTGRNARPEIIELAHTVTDMKVIKPAYQQGIKAKRGIEF